MRAELSVDVIIPHRELKLYRLWKIPLRSREAVEPRIQASDDFAFKLRQRQTPRIPRPTAMAV